MSKILILSLAISFLTMSVTAGAAAPKVTKKTTSTKKKLTNNYFLEPAANLQTGNQQLSNGKFKCGKNKTTVSLPDRFTKPSKGWEMKLLAWASKKPVAFKINGGVSKANKSLYFTHHIYRVKYWGKIYYEVISGVQLKAHKHLSIKSFKRITDCKQAFLAFGFSGRAADVKCREVDADNHKAKQAEDLAKQTAAAKKVAEGNAKAVAGKKQVAADKKKKEADDKAKKAAEEKAKKEGKAPAAKKDTKSHAEKHGKAKVAKKQEKPKAKPAKQPKKTQKRKLLVCLNKKC